ncbi:SGNH/GDSL hydrolase family protein [Streptomyces sp. NPDC055078]
MSHAVRPLSLLLAPALIPQALWVRRRTPRLPVAAGTEGESPGGWSDGSSGGSPGGSSGGSPRGSSGHGPALRLLVAGDSMAAGVGVAHQSQGLAGQLAARMAAGTGRPVRWRVVARSGATAVSTARLLADDASAGREAAGREPVPEGGGDPDLVVVVVGINDLLRYRGLRAWRRDLGVLVGTLRERWGARVPVVFSGMPPVGHFRALPQPLRAVLGLRARRMDRVLLRSAAGSGVRYVPLPAAGDVPGREGGVADEAGLLFARDRFHPSARGYAEVARVLAPLALESVGAR